MAIKSIYKLKDERITSDSIVHEKSNKYINLKKYLDEGDSDDDISLNLIDEKGFTEYGYSAEVPVLDGQSVSYGAFKSRTESIKEQAIEIDLNKGNVEKYIK